MTYIRPTTKNEGCFGEEAGVYISVPLVAQLYIFGKNNDDALKDLIAEAVRQIIEAAKSDDDSVEALNNIADLLGVVSVGTFTLWYMNDLHLCDEIGAAVEKAAELIEVTADDFAKDEK